MSESAGTAAPSAGNSASPSFQSLVNGGPKTSGGPPSSVRDAIARATAADPGRPDGSFDPDRPERTNDSRSTNPMAGRKPPPDPAKAPPKQATDQQPERQQTRLDDDISERKLRAKVNGQEKEVSIREMLDYYQRGESANKRFQEAAELRKQAETAKERAERLLRDPKALIDTLINDADGAKTVHEAYQELTRLAQMTPEQQQEYLRTRELEQRAAKLEAIEAEQRQAQERAQEEAIIDQHLDGLEDAYEKLGWQPSEGMQDLTDMLAASIIEEVREQGMKGVTYRHIAGTVQEMVQDITRESLSSMDDAALRELIGEKRLRSLMAEDVKRVTGRLPQQTQRTQQARQPSGQFAQKPQGPRVHNAGDIRGFRALLEGD